MSSAISGPKPPAIDYPCGDGQPMAETWLHVQAIMLLHQALEDFFRGRPDVFIASDQFWYWEEGNPAARLAPDVMVITGLRPRDPRERRSFFTWEEGGAVPAVVFEMASKSTWREDLDEKFDRYEELGVREYFLFDPEGLYLVPRLQGFRLNGKAYRRLRQEELKSELGFGLLAEDFLLRLVDLETGEKIPTRAEAVDAAQKNVVAERNRAEALQSEVERLKALLQQSPRTDENGSGK